MTEIHDIFVKLVEQYGVTTTIVIAALFGFGLIVYRLIKSSSEAITKFVENKLSDSTGIHKKALAHRKNITPYVREILSELAEKTDADRTLLFEYSNGNSNLVGLPFLYVTATCEFVRPGVNPVSQNYQRINTSLCATLVEDMDNLGYVYVEDIEDMKNVYPVVYSMMKPNNVKSAIFYPLFGMDCPVGFIVLTGLNNKIINRKEVIPITSTSAQRISALVNFDNINDGD